MNKYCISIHIDNSIWEAITDKKNIQKFMSLCDMLHLEYALSEYDANNNIWLGIDHNFKYE